MLSRQKGQLRGGSKDCGGTKGLGMDWEAWQEVPGLGNTRHKSIGQQEDLAILVLRRLTYPNLISYKILGFNSARG